MIFLPVCDYFLNNLKIDQQSFDIKHIVDSKLRELLVCLMTNVFIKYLINRAYVYQDLQSRTNFEMVNGVSLSLLTLWKDYSQDDLLVIVERIVISNRNNWNDFLEFLYTDKELYNLIKDNISQNYPYMNQKFMSDNNIEDLSLIHISEPTRPY